MSNKSRTSDVALVLSLAITCMATLAITWLGAPGFQRLTGAADANSLKLGLIVVLLVLFGLCGFFATRMARDRASRDSDVVARAEAEAKALAEANEKIAEAQKKVEIAEDVARQAAAGLEKKVEELKEARGGQAENSRLATVGRLTSTIAHDLRNPLGAVRTAAYLIERKTQDLNLGLEKSLHRVENGIKRCDNMITQLLDFARTKELVPEAVKLDEWVRRIVGDREIPEQVSVQYDLQLGDATVTLDPTRFQRVLTNLVDNAVEAMKVDAGASTVASPLVTIRTAVNGERVEISVIDNGPGIPAENLGQIFEPLFSTKPSGVGLGLPAVQQIVEQHAGGLEVASVQGNGTTATAWLPLGTLQQQAA